MARKPSNAAESIEEALVLARAHAPDLVISAYRLREAQASGIPILHKPVTPGQLYRGLVTLLPH